MVLDNINVFESRDVAEMVGKTHSNLLRDIKNYIKGMEKDPKSSVISANSEKSNVNSAANYQDLFIEIYFSFSYI